MKNTLLVLFGFGFVLALVSLFFILEINTRDAICQETLRTIQKAYEAKKIKKEVTGYSLFHAINEYRKKNGARELMLSKTLCNNIASRAKNYEEGKGHEGLEKHQEFLGLNNITELLTAGQTEEEIISRWEKSPSHHLFLIDKKMKYGCTYADYYMEQPGIYTAVLLMSW